MRTLQFPHQTKFYRGKVRDVYTIADQWLVMIASDRISAFDVILPRPIAYKGQVLNQIAAYMLKATSDLCPNWLLDTPAPNVAVGRLCEPFRVEMVVRGNLTGHAWRTYQSGKRELCGVPLPEGMKENDLFPRPHHHPIYQSGSGPRRRYLPQRDHPPRCRRQVRLRVIWKNIPWPSSSAAGRSPPRRGLILVDTKYEFGKIDDTIYLMDEIHTPDSSRYFYAEGFEERQARGERQLQLSKEFVREWLIAGNFMGKEGQTVPEMTDDWVQTISNRYIELYEKVIGEPFRPQSLSDEEIYQRVLYSLGNLEA